MISAIHKEDGQWPPLYAWRSIKTSAKMNKALRALVKDPGAQISKATGSALMARGFLDAEHHLTDTGRVYAISVCSLKDQCTLLNLPFEEMALRRSSKRPEFDLQAHYEANDWKGSFSECGIIFVLLYAIWLDQLFEYAMRKNDCNEDYVKADMYNVYSYNQYLDDFPESTQQLTAAIENAIEEDVRRNYRTIEASQYSDTWFPYGYYGITEELVLKCFSIMGKARLVAIARVFLSDRWLYSKGWPDLLFIRESEMRLIEVKTSDKLHISQIIVMPTMQDAAQLDMRVVKIGKRKI